MSIPVDILNAWAKYAASKGIEGNVTSEFIAGYKAALAAVAKLAPSKTRFG